MTLHFLIFNLKQLAGWQALVSSAHLHAFQHLCSKLPQLARRQTGTWTQVKAFHHIKLLLFLFHLISPHNYEPLYLCSINCLASVSHAPLFVTFSYSTTTFHLLPPN